MPDATSQHGLLDNRVRGEGVKGEKVRRLTMRRVEFRSAADLMENPAGRVVEVLAHIEAPASRVMGH